MKLLTVKQVAEILQVTEQTVYNLMSRGKLEKVKVGRASRIEETELQEYINRNKTTQPEYEREEGQEYINTNKASKLLGVSVRTVQRYVKQGKLQGYKDEQGNWQVSKQSIKEYQELIQTAK